jgi:hypothetical protein
VVVALDQILNGTLEFASQVEIRIAKDKISKLERGQFLRGLANDELANISIFSVQLHNLHQTIPQDHVRIVAAQIVKEHHQLQLLLAFEVIAASTPRTLILPCHMTMVTNFGQLGIKRLLAFFALGSCIILLLLFFRQLGQPWV